MIQRATVIAGIGGLVLGGAVLAALALQSWRGGATAGAGIEPAPPPVLEPATPLPITPTAPITPALHPEWYPTSAPFHLSPALLARTVAFAPGAFDVAFTINRAAEGDARDVFLMADVPDGTPSGLPEPLLGLPDGMSALELKSSNEAGKYAVAGSAGGASGAGGRFSGIWLAAADGSSVERVVDAPDGVDDFWWRPDGAALALLHPDGRLTVRGLVDGEERVVASGLIGPTGRASVLLSWSPDGRHAALGTFDREDLSAILEVLDVGTGSRTVVADFGVPGVPLPVYDPSGDVIYAFVADGKHPTVAALHAVDPDVPGADVVLADLSTQGDAPAWIGTALADPRGGALFFVQDGAVFRIGVDGVDRRLLVPKGDEVVRGDIALQALADGRARIAYVASAYVGPSFAAGAAAQSVSTTFAVRTVDVSAP